MLNQTIKYSWLGTNSLLLTHTHKKTSIRFNIKLFDLWKKKSNFSR